MGSPSGPIPLMVVKFDLLITAIKSGGLARCAWGDWVPRRQPQPILQWRWEVFSVLARSDQPRKVRSVVSASDKSKDACKSTMVVWSDIQSGGKDMVSSGRLHFESERARRKVEAAALSLPHFSRAPRIRKWRPKARTKEAGHP